MSIGENIKKYRKIKSLTQTQLAKEIGKSESTIQKYEANEVMPPIDVLTKISEVFNISIGVLIKDTNEPNINEIRSKVMDSMFNEIQNTIDVDPESELIYSLKMKELYDKYFFDLFYWKTSTMTPHEFFKFMLSISQFNEVTDLTESDIDELSIMFYRLLQLKSVERHSINESIGMIPIDNYEEKFEYNNFLRTNAYDHSDNK